MAIQREQTEEEHSAEDDGVIRPSKTLKQAKPDA